MALLCKFNIINQQSLAEKKKNSSLRAPTRILPHLPSLPPSLPPAVAKTRRPGTRDEYKDVLSLPPYRIIMKSSSTHTITIKSANQTKRKNDPPQPPSSPSQQWPLRLFSHHRLIPRQRTPSVHALERLPLGPCPGACS